MKVRLLKKVRRMAYETYGMCCELKPWGVWYYYVDRRENLKKYRDSRNEYPYTECIKKLAVWRRQFILDRLYEMRRDIQEKERNKELEKL